MGYFLQAIIAPTAALASAEVPGTRVVPLQGGVSMIALGDECCEKLNIPAFLLEDESTSTLSGPTLDLCRRLSTHTRLIYVEAAFHGGPPGLQAYVPFEAGEAAGEAKKSDEYGPISEGLRFLGVDRGSFGDEFERVCLDRYRDTNGWLSPDPSATPDDLVKYCTDFARTMLEESGQFLPFGAAIRADGWLTGVGGYNGEVQPAPAEIYGLLSGAFASQAKEKSILAAALTVNVDIPAKYETPLPDGIRIWLEGDGYSRFIYLPYRLKKRGLFRKGFSIEIADPFVVELPPAWFKSGDGA